MEPKKTLSKARIRRLRAQGYINQSAREISQLAWGNRFTFILYSIVLALALIFSYQPLYIGIFGISILGIILPHHPFDYIYNYLLAKPFGKPMIPVRSEQLKFTCYLDSIIVLITIYLLIEGFTIAGYLVGGSLLVVAIVASVTDFCLPSTIYNALLLEPPVNLRGESNYESNQ